MFDLDPDREFFKGTVREISSNFSFKEGYTLFINHFIVSVAEIRKSFILDKQQFLIFFLK